MLIPYVGQVVNLRPIVNRPALVSKLHQVTPLIQERIKLLRDVTSVADFFFADTLAPYDPAELIPQKGDQAMARSALQRAREVLTTAEFNHASLDAALRTLAQEMKIKPGQLFQPSASPSAAAKTRRPF